jgi:hypothetical protein
MSYTVGGQEYSVQWKLKSLDAAHPLQFLSHWLVGQLSQYSIENWLSYTQIRY